MNDINPTDCPSIFEKLTSRKIRWYASGSKDGNYLFELPDAPVESLLTTDWQKGIDFLTEILEFQQGEDDDPNDA